MSVTLEYRDPEYHLQRTPRCGRRVTSIVLHTAAHPSWTTQQIREFHVQERGYRDIGYHWVVERDGSVVRGRPEIEMGAHCQNWNAESIGVCFSGHGDHQVWTPSQRAAGVALVAELCLRYNVAVQNVYGHRELNEGRKSCPGSLVDLDSVRAMVLLRLGDRSLK